MMNSRRKLDLHHRFKVGEVLMSSRHRLSGSYNDKWEGKKVIIRTTDIRLKKKVLFLVEHLDDRELGCYATPIHLRRIKS